MANKRRTRTRTKISTFGTDLGSVVRFNPNNFNSISFSFILDEILQLEETPITNPIVHSLSSPNISDSFEVFQDNFASIKIVHNFLADAVINCSHKPSLPARDFLQQSLGRLCAFALQFIPQEYKFSLNLFDLRGMEELIVGSDSKIMDSQVHTENSVRTRTHGAFLGECEHKEALAFIVNSQKAFIDFPTEIIFETIRDSKWNFDSSFNCGDTQNIILKRETPRRVVSNRAGFDNRVYLSFFNHTTRLSNARDSELAWQPNFSQFGINEGMKFNIISNLHSPSNINTHLHPCFIKINSINNILSWFNSDFSSCSGSHSLLRSSDYLNLSEGISPPKPEGLGIRNATFI